jgi:hypothetical protein
MMESPPSCTGGGLTQASKLRGKFEIRNPKSETNSNERKSKENDEQMGRRPEGKLEIRISEENPKFEYRNPKQIRMSGNERKRRANRRKPSRFSLLFYSKLRFEFVSDFGFRASDLF